ncbi:ATP-binding protein [Nocardiopsis composta]|uniref:Anti-sigma regulatory factor (Ser/Thr protein kinase) n=1 Tax=Nocardiopsis composta TaxID=157465 RepID=A0A7W8QTA9_9ACTN|nr:ATP-binding protein [Nocardiopsis composta]MBB5435201.1 anti-sigma regulatory factor (Ser/Thr protein kinase) [Nocardiopsis composta]
MAAVCPPSRVARVRRYARPIRPDMRSVPRLRAWARRKLRNHPRVDDAALVVSELVTNALLHGAPPRRGRKMRVCIFRCGPEVEVAVTNPVLPWTQPSPYALPEEGADSPGGETGRGLTIVEAVSDAWGIRRGRDTVTVWARFLPTPVPLDLMGTA